MNNGIETTTWHDQRPTHPPKTPEISAMEDKLADAIARADDLLERWLHDQTGSILFSEIEAANEHVILVQDALYYLLDVWHGNDCTCTPLSATCQFCRLHSRYKKYMEQCSENKKEN